jgi:hypothetical protein
MTGVEILASSEVEVDWLFNWKVFWIAVIVTWIVMFVISIIVYIIDGNLDAAFIPAATIICGTLGGIMFGVLFGCVKGEPIEYETQYKVTISDEVLMNELLEKYEIIEQDGKIYKVRERE